MDITPPEPTPESTDPLDVDLRKTLRTQRVLMRMIIVVLTVFAVLGTAGYLALYNGQHDEVNELKTAVIQITQGGCGLYQDVGDALPQPEENPLPSKLGVKIVIDARDAFARAHCPGQLVSPNGELLNLAAKYGLTVSH